MVNSARYGRERAAQDLSIVKLHKKSLGFSPSDFCLSLCFYFDGGFQQGADDNEDDPECQRLAPGEGKGDTKDGEQERQKPEAKGGCQKADQGNEQDN